MPLVRFQVRNEYGLGQQELYKDVDRDDPKDVLEGVTVAGLVGILRQLGDLAKFAAEVFHGLQEQVTVTASRNKKLMTRAQRVEAALSPPEKAIWSQKKHLHFAYTSGSQWHTRVKNEQNLLIYDDLPQFVTDSYEECRGPPRLQLLDRFDPGGTGSCLKRYSDPTFFQRASGISSETSAGKASKDRKARRRKCKVSILNLQKERACQNNGEASNSCSSIPDQYPRNKFASLDVDDQDISTFSLMKSSESEDRSNSFDSGLGSGYIECDLHPTFTIKPQEHGPVEPSISDVEMQHNDMFDSNSLEEQTLAADGDFAEDNSSAGSAGLRSSCVTWDEKTEITAHKAETQDSELSHLRSKYNTDFQFHKGEDRKGLTFTHVNEPHDIESQLDNNGNALNTVESESESDLDCQSKRELEHFSTQCLHDKVAGEMHEVSEPDRLNSESGSTSYQPKSNSPDTDILELPHIKESPQVAEQSPMIDFSKNSILHDQDAEARDNDKSSGECKEKSLHILESSSEIENPQVDYSSVQFRSSSLDLSCSNTRELDLQTPINDKILSTSNEPQQVPARISSSHSVQFWTNGGLLGLEPSKPPVFSKDNSLGQDVVGPLNQDIICMNDGDMAKSKRFSPTALDIDRRISRFSTEEHGLENNNGNNFDRTICEQIGTKLVNTTDARDFPTDSSQGNGENAQQAVGLANRLLSNSFQQKVLALHHEKSKTPTTANIGFPGEQSEHCMKRISGQNIKDLFGDGSQENNSPPSSPPIQHMKKISFQTPIGFEISKLKLKLPDGNHFHDNGSGDMVLPLFQLVPESGTSHNDNSLDSDDDTFCRSSPYDSDDCNNHGYESNSEQWGSDTASQNKDNELYGVLGRISLKEESMSISLESDQNPNIEICEEHLRFMHSLDLPCFNTLNPLFEQDTESSTKEPTPIHAPAVAACDET